MAKDGKLKRKDYEKELDKLQVELSHLQEWVKVSGERIIIALEGRDAAGKGGLIKAMTERVSPRVFRVVALPAPSDREKTQMYFQRYMERFPAAGEIVIFDRSWYNRAGVEHVMGFCTPEQHQRFLELCPVVEERAIRRGSFVSTADLVKKIDRFIRNHNARPAPFVWTASADSILPKLTRLCQRISGTEH